MLEVLYRAGLRIPELQFLTQESAQACFILVENMSKQKKVPVFSTLARLAKTYEKKTGIMAGSFVVNCWGIR